MAVYAGKGLNRMCRNYNENVYYSANKTDVGNGYYFGMPRSVKSDNDNKDESGQSKKRVAISAVKPGMIIAKDVYSRNDQLIIARGTELTPDIIAKLMFYAIDGILVYTNNGENGVKEELSVKCSEELKREYIKTLEIVKNEFEKAVIAGADFDEDKLLSGVEEIFTKDNGRAEVINLIHGMRDFDNDIYTHAVNVALLCKIFAEWLEIKGNDAETLILCGLFHDIGKMLIPKDIINKPGDLTRVEYEVIKQHTIRGYELLKEKKIDERICLSALRHHERYDGKGYPNACRGEEIDMFSMITGIADAYSAMAFEHSYKPAKCPYDILFVLESKKEIFAPQYLIPIMNNIAESYINHEVILDNEKKANIVLLNPDDLSKPVVRAGDEFIDLSKKRDIKITDMF